jgi:hypothetical protein
MATVSGRRRTSVADAELAKGEADSPSHMAAVAGFRMGTKVATRFVAETDGNASTAAPKNTNGAPYAMSMGFA